MNRTDAYILFHEGTKLFAEMSQTGICVDVPYLEKLASTVLPQKMEYWKNRLLEYPEIKKWKKSEGRDWSLESWVQTQRLLYRQMKYSPPRGSYSTDKDTLKTLNPPFLEELLNYRKYLSCYKTFVLNLLREQVDGVVHADMNLVIPVSYRGSCSSPNLQNQPTRDEMMSRIIKRAFLPREGYLFTEYDFKAMEVCINACYNQDPTLIDYLTDPNKDMHWDSARMMFKIDNEESEFDKGVFKKIRYVGKNGFTFPQFYGSWWKDCAYNVWQYVDLYTLPNGKTLRENLKDKGVYGLGELYEDDKGRLKADKGTFYDHMRTVEQKFWNEMFPVYKQWKEDWYKKYIETGQFKMKTGFVVRDIVGRNDCTNYPAQGVGFHVLLKALIDTAKWIKEKKLPAHYLLQVHDSGLNEHKPQATEELDKLMVDTVKNRIPKEWEWINVPLVLEAERGKVNASWYEVNEEIELE